jgi:cGMP-dependent protein kinase 2
MMTYTLILKGVEKMDFPKKISKRPEDLIRKLCRYLIYRVIDCLYIV